MWATLQLKCAVEHRSLKLFLKVHSYFYSPVFSRDMHVFGYKYAVKTQAHDFKTTAPKRNLTHFETFFVHPHN